MSAIKKYVLYFLLLVYFCGSIGFVVNPDFFSPFTPFTLLLTAVVFLVHQPLQQYSFVAAFISMAAMGYFFEVLGVKTGLVFGDYAYGNNLGYKIFDVPLVISFNWALMISAGVMVCSRMMNNKYAVLASSAVLVTLIDLLIEQVAYKLDFWAFEGGMPGIHNYIGWILVSCIVPFFFYSTLVKGNYNIAIIILLLQVFFFGTVFVFI
jgi:bisanhydrobacterioruberin hydratase